jgi:glycine hydroxymethyltransferase
VTTRGMTEPDMARIAGWVAEVLTHMGDADRERRIRAEVADFAVQFPLYTRRWDIAPAMAGGRDSAR